MTPRVLIGLAYGLLATLLACGLFNLSSFHWLPLSITIVLIAGVWAIVGLALVLYRISKHLKRHDERLAAAVHELRGPLQRLRLAQARLTRNPATHDEALIEISRDIDILDETLRRFAELVQLERKTLQPRETPIGPLLDDLLLRHRITAEEQGLTLSLAPLPSLAQRRTDPDLLTRLLDQLLSNACAYTPPGGRVDIQAEERGGRLILTIRDTGPGIPENEQGHIFDAFVRGHDARLMEASGMGLGLAFARRAALALGARLRLRNRTQGGLEASLSLP